MISAQNLLETVSQLSDILNTINTQSPTRFLTKMKMNILMIQFPAKRHMNMQEKLRCSGCLISQERQDCDLAYGHWTLVYLILKISDLLKTYKFKIKKNTAKIFVKHFPHGPASSTCIPNAMSSTDSQTQLSLKRVMAPVYLFSNEVDYLLKTCWLVPFICVPFPLLLLLFLLSLLLCQNKEKKIMENHI